MARPYLPAWRRCRVLFALALCAWLGLVGAAWAQVDCCGASADTTMPHHGGQPPQAGHGAACACPVVPVVPHHGVALAVVAPDVMASALRAMPTPDVVTVPPLRPPLA